MGRFVALAVLGLLVAGCLAEPGRTAADVPRDCYPVIQRVGGPNSLDDEDPHYVGNLNLVNLTDPSPVAFRAVRVCEPVRWLVEVGADTSWVEGPEITLDRAVGAYILNLVLDLDVPTVMHSTVVLIEDRRDREPIAAPAATTDVVHSVEVVCCVTAMGARAHLVEPGLEPPIPDGQWVTLTDPFGKVVASGSQSFKMAHDGNPPLPQISGTWEFRVVRSDPMSPFWNQAVSFRPDAIPWMAFVREPGSPLESAH